MSDRTRIRDLESAVENMLICGSVKAEGRLCKTCQERARFLLGQSASTAVRKRAHSGEADGR